MTELSSRGQRVADQIQRELATLIQLEVRDPRVGMVSITGIDLSRDLAHAKVFITVLDTVTTNGAIVNLISAEEDDLDLIQVQDNVKALNKAAGFLRSLLSKRLALRAVPKLRFFYDASIENGQRLSGLIDDALTADQEQRPASDFENFRIED
ncbi:MAG: 30S ribosome-binding factor RbfA [Gammaproteobacteria bacterium]|nr:30S ribosome-binding factor RbfA [Gammaproteobacteria bacterium]MDG1953241.1 30S ribosome-binding factor RbfA [Gammaproteobacteria bacterium]MDG2117428.1 30S ribosome-binding factor RbfA [Gammaproteobacteria bacterium]